MLAFEIILITPPTTVLIVLLVVEPVVLIVSSFISIELVHKVIALVTLNLKGKKVLFLGQSYLYFFSLEALHILFYIINLTFIKDPFF